jgi:CBS domain containing-hemolysin-like protein
LILATAFGSFLSESLQHFSRSRLDQACRRLGRIERFGVILRRSADALLTVRLLTLVLLLILAAWTGIRFVSDLIDERNSPGRLVVFLEPILIAAVFVVMFALIPWGLARVTGEQVLARIWPGLEFLIRLARPYVAVARRLDSFLHRLWGLKEPDSAKAESLAQEIKSVVDLGQREGILPPSARRMIERVIALQQEDVGAVMTPRTDMDCVPADATLEEARRLMVEGAHSRMPVIGTSTDDIVGILYAKDLLGHSPKETDGRELRARDIVREPFYVPETISIDKLLESMKRKRVHIAIVIDEYSGVAGLVTMEDVLEQIVGEIVDEYDTAEDTGIRQISPGSIEVAARVRIDDLDEQFGLDLPDDEDYDTIGGFVYAQFGRIPRKREILMWKQIRLTVLDADKRRIHKIRLDMVPAERMKAEG